MFAGVGMERLRLFRDRARLLTKPDAAGYLRADVDLPSTREEIFFDIEADPLRPVNIAATAPARRFAGTRPAATTDPTPWGADQ